MPESYFLLAATFLPLLLAPASYLIAKKIGVNSAVWFSFGIMAISTALLLIPAFSLHGGTSGYSESYTWSPFAGDFGLRLDGLSLPFAAIIYVLCTVLTLYSKPYMLHKITDRFHEQVGTGQGSISTANSGNSSGSDSIAGQTRQNAHARTVLTSTH